MADGQRLHTLGEWLVEWSKEDDLPRKKCGFFQHKLRVWALTPMLFTEESAVIASVSEAIQQLRCFLDCFAYARNDDA